jgi:Ni,Fe-hydrogenase III small subunit
MFWRAVGSLRHFGELLAGSARGSARDQAHRPRLTENSLGAVAQAGGVKESRERLDASGRHVALDLARCVFCGRCAEVPWDGAVTIGRDFELAARSRDELSIEVVADDPPVPAAAPARDPDAEAARASSEIYRVLGRSLHLRHLDAGSCNACDWELTALLNPGYDVRRLGTSPRHADGVVVTGPVTRNLETAVRRTFEAIPEPRLVIAVGACAGSGGIVGEGYASAGGVDRVLPVDVYIPGCPPRPEAILFGILVALGRLDARRLPQGARER